MRYRSPSSILPWRVVPPASCKVSRVSQYSGYQPDWLLFAYRCFTFCAWPFQTIRLRSFLFLPVLNPTKPKFHGLGSSPFARRYLGNLNWLLFLWVLRCFSSPGLPLSYHHMTDGGLPHSDMHGSQDACSYPCLFAAYRVLHRLLAPRHPPYALVHLTYLRSFAFVFANVICLNPKMLGSIHFKLIREANSFNEVRTFVLTIVSVNNKSLTVYLYGEFVFCISSSVQFSKINNGGPN